jgi:hypothetical protein
MSEIVDSRRLRVLLFCDEAARHAGTLDEHINALETCSQHWVTSVDLLGATKLSPRFELFDAIVFHYSVAHILVQHLPQPLCAGIIAYNGPKLLFIQDEYQRVDATAATVRDLGIGVIFSVTGPDVIRKVYHHRWLDQVRFETTLTGFVPANFLTRAVPDYEKRPIDVSYRARRLPAWLGEFGQEKWRIGARFLEDARRHGLACDIAMSEAERIYGVAWINFVANSRAVLGTESGASFIDYAGDVQKRVEAYAAAHPDASFEEIRDRFLEGRDGATVIRVISPRCFEAAALKTLMILYPGNYSGILEPHRHYVVLERDHSNMNDVVRILRDPERAGSIIEAAYQEIACSPRWTFQALADHVDKVLGEEHAKWHSGKCHCALAERQASQLPGGRVPADPAQYFHDLTQAARTKSRWRRRKMATALWLQRLGIEARKLSSRLLPAAVASRLQSATSVAGMRVKPLLKRLLLGRRD